jgi:uncharacterized membrane protein
MSNQQGAGTPDREQPEDSKKEGQPTSPSDNPSSIPTKSQEQDARQRVDSLRVIRAELWAESTFSGPLPHPDILVKFEHVIPGAAERLLRMAEKQSNHRQSLERTVVDADIRRSWAGLWTGFVIGLTGMIGSVVLGLYDHPGLGGFLGGTTLVSLVSVFVIGTKSRREERMQKTNVMTGGNVPADSTPPAGKQTS